MVIARPPFGKPPAWVLAACVILGLPATSWIYWPAIGEAGVLSPEADTIIIPMMSSIFLAVVLLPIVSVITWLCLRGNDDTGSLLSWDRTRPVRSALVTFCFAIPFCFGLFSLVNEVTAPPGWHGLWWLPNTLVTLFWLATMRGSALSKRNGTKPPQLRKLIVSDALNGSGRPASPDDRPMSDFGSLCEKQRIFNVDALGIERCSRSWCDQEGSE